MKSQHHVIVERLVDIQRPLLDLTKGEFKDMLGYRIVLIQKIKRPREGVQK